MKYLLILLAILIAYWIIKSYKRKATDPDRKRGGSTPGEDMVRCAHCGVHLPRSESLMTGETFFCSPEHRRLHDHS